MWIRLSEISPHGVAVSTPVSLEQLGLANEAWRTDGPVRMHLMVTREAELIVVGGDVSATLRIPCSRCLQECTYPVNGTVQLSLAPEGARGSVEGAHQLTEEDLEQLYYREGGFETNDIVREQLLLSIPMRVVCRPECRGLCATCGKNLNEGPCGCPEPAPSRLAEQLKRWQSGERHEG
ncbi:MAG TPA: DUF177 domain-containing protein [Nitrospiria bacterium]|nr:DUF177 domain-containing protein [Nitrospiria bacterium]